MAKSVQTLEEVTIRFAGDSGDGMQLTGTQFTNTVAALGNDLSTLPDYPAEIRAPAGTTYGVSGFQIKFGSTDILTPGDTCDVLVAMNPAALVSNLKVLRDGFQKAAEDPDYIALMDKVTLPRTYLDSEKFQEFLIGMEKSLEPTLDQLGLLKKK